MKGVLAYKLFIYSDQTGFDIFISECNPFMNCASHKGDEYKKDYIKKSVGEKNRVT